MQKQRPSVRKSRAKTSKRFVLRVAVYLEREMSRTQARMIVESVLGSREEWASPPPIKSARVTNADIP